MEDKVKKHLENVHLVIDMVKFITNVHLTLNST